MAETERRHIERFRGAVPQSEDGRFESPTVYRNAPPIIAQLAQIFGHAPGRVLEIGCGTGQHSALYSQAFPAIEWWPSDPDPDHRTSTKAWARHWNAPERSPLDLDAAADWASDPRVNALGPLTAVYSSNVIHIAPFAVAVGIIAGAGKILSQNGLLIFYGPFREGGAHTGDGNRAFDAGLRAENPDWGVRDVDELRPLAEAAGLVQDRMIVMPANNRLLIFRKA